MTMPKKDHRWVQLPPLRVEEGLVARLRAYLKQHPEISVQKLLRSWIAEKLAEAEGRERGGVVMDRLTRNLAAEVGELKARIQTLEEGEARR